MPRKKTNNSQEIFVDRVIEVQDDFEKIERKYLVEIKGKYNNEEYTIPENTTVIIWRKRDVK